MGLDIGLKLNKEVASAALRDKFYSTNTANTADDIYCMSRGYCNLILSKHSPESEELVAELSKALAFDCGFLQEPKVNHYEEDEETKFQFGWVNSTQFLDNLKKVKALMHDKTGFSANMNLSEAWKQYFGGQDPHSFSQDVENIIEIIDVANAQGTTELCYSVG